MTYEFPFSGVLIESGTLTRTRPIGQLYDCVDDPFAPCCDCFPPDGQIMYFITGDVFTHQINFAADSLTVYNFDGTVIGDFNSWINGNVITVSVDDLDDDIDCFYFSIEFRGERFCFDFGLKRHGTKELDYCYGGDCGIGTITIESAYTTTDCLGNQYGSGIYSNKRRFLAEVEFISNVEEATLIDDTRISSKVYSQFQVRILQPLKQNSRLLSEFVEVIMRGAMKGSSKEGDPNIVIDNGFPVEGIFCTDFIDGLSRSYDSQRDWYPVFTVRQLECDSNLSCN